MCSRIESKVNALFSIVVPSCSSLISPASVCFVVCLLSLAWALVLYARACSLIRPGHLHMTPAAILCRLLWRVSISYHPMCVTCTSNEQHLDMWRVWHVNIVFWFCDGGIASVCRSVCWGLDSPFSCSSHVSLKNGSWGSLVSLNAGGSSHSSLSLINRESNTFKLVTSRQNNISQKYIYVNGHIKCWMLNWLCVIVRCALAWYNFLDGVSADWHNTFIYSMENLQSRSGGHSHLPFPQCEVWSIQMPHGWLLPGMCNI